MENRLQSIFEKRLDAVRSKKRAYDCMVPVSGGKDSMYVLYVCSKIYNMKVLAFNYDNGFQSPGAVKNMEKAVAILGVDFIKYKPREDLLVDLYRTFLTRTGDFCAPCNLLITASFFKFAEQNKIPLIVTGNTPRWASSVHGMSISKYGTIPYFQNVVKGFIDTEKIKNLMDYNYFLDTLKRRIVVGCETCEMFEYINPMKNQLQETLMKELGWEPPSDELEHGDCLLNPIKDYIVCRKWGFSEITGGYATMVRNGKMSREEAIRIVEKEETKNPPAMLEVFLDKINVTHDEFERAIEKLHFTDFPNSYGALYNSCKKIYRRLKRGRS